MLPLASHTLPTDRSIADGKRATAAAGRACGPFSICPERAPERQHKHKQPPAGDGDWGATLRLSRRCVRGRWSVRSIASRATSNTTPPTIKHTDGRGGHAAGQAEPSPSQVDHFKCLYWPLAASSSAASSSSSGLLHFIRHGPSGPRLLSSSSCKWPSPLLIGLVLGRSCRQWREQLGRPEESCIGARAQIKVELNLFIFIQVRAQVTESQKSARLTL